MVDPIQYVIAGEDEEDRDERAELSTDIELQPGGSPICSCSRCVSIIYSNPKKPKFSGYSRINPLIEGTTLTPHQFFLCDSMVEAFVFKLRDWSKFSVPNPFHSYEAQE